MHSHLAGEEEQGQGYASLVMRSGAQDAIVGVRNARLVLEAGFTTVRDVGSFRAFTDIAIREGIEEGWFPGPRMLCAGAYVTCPGGGGDITGLAVDVDAVVPSELRFGVTSGVDQMRANVRRIIARGADFIKIIATGAVLTSGTNPARPSSPRTSFAQPSRRPRSSARSWPRTRTARWGSRARSVPACARSSTPR